MSWVLCGIWGLLVGLAPIGIWKAKARLTVLEERVNALEGRSSKVASYQKPLSAPIPTPAKEVTPIQAKESQDIDHEQKRAEIPQKIIDEANDESSITRRPLPETPKPQPQASRSYTPAISQRDETPEWFTRWLTGGRLFVTLGLGLLFIGVAMLFKYFAYTVSIEARFTAVAIGAIALIGFGGYVMRTRRDYGLYLQGGGLGLLFLTVFTAFKFYSLLMPPAAFTFLVLIGAITFAFSITADSMALSVLAVTGGFLAPLLTSTGQGSHIELFSYYLLLNVIIFAIAWFKSWRELNTTGFFFTFAIGIFWGGKYYVPEFYTSVQSFLVIFFLLYVGIGILFAKRTPPKLSTPVDASSIFGVPLIGFGLQLALVQHMPNGFAISSLVMALGYGALFLLLRMSSNPSWKLLSRIFMGFSILFYTLAVAFAFDTQVIATLWSLEAVALLWMMKQTKQKLYGHAGVLLLFLADICMYPAFNVYGIEFIYAHFISVIILSFTHFAASFLLNDQDSIDSEGALAGLFSLGGMGWWLAAWTSQIYMALAFTPQFMMTWLICYALSALVAYRISRSLAVPLLDKPIALLLPLMMCFAGFQIMNTMVGYHPLQYYGAVAWPVAFAAHYIWLWMRKDKSESWQHSLAYILMVLLIGFEAGYQLYSVHLMQLDAYKLAGWMIAAAGGTLLVALPPKHQFWPVSALDKKEAGDVLALWAGVLCLWSFTKETMSVNGAYLPFLNLLEIAEIATIVALTVLYRAWGEDVLSRKTTGLLLMVSGFAFLNAVPLRMVSSYLGLMYLSPRMFDAVEVQTLLTILWAVISMVAMMFSSYKHLRKGWLMGAILLGVVVIKLFTVDLAGVGTLSRIISFMGVGLLSVLLGYFSPMPPKNAER